MTHLPPQRRIGLTGGISTGKSTVSRYLAEVHQLPILDADIYARKAVQPGSPVLANIYERYGDRLTSRDGTLNRQALGDIIFNDATEKQWLEAQIHPYVHGQFEADLKVSRTQTIILVIPLLFEAQMTDLVTEIWVVNCPLTMQIQRLIDRDHLSESQAQQRIQNQWPLSQKTAAADIVLENHSTLVTLFQQVDQALGLAPTQPGTRSQS